jgi:hypothetical protein
VTDRAGAYDHVIRALPAILAALALAACGAGSGNSDQRSTLPPRPGPAGEISLRLLAAHPEVYADAQVQTQGALVAIRVHGRRRYSLTGGGGARIVVEPNRLAAPHAGERVRVLGIFVVSFEDGYEILASRVTPLAS